MRDDIAPIFTKDFVDARVAEEMEGFEELMGLLEGGGGFPWMVVLNPDGSAVVTSDHPENGNVGFPVADWEIEYFKVMMQTSAQRITAEEIEFMATAMAEGTEEG